MKKTFGKILLTATFALTCSLGLAACSGKDETPTYDYLVTFNYNVGSIDANCPDQYLGVGDGALVSIQPGYSDLFKYQEVIGYYNEGWYLAQEDAEGNPVVGEDGRVMLAEKWDFDADTVTENITLYANLVLKPVLTVTGGDEDVTFSKLPGETQREPSSAFKPQKEGYTFLGYYEDAAYTTPFTFPYTFGNEHKTVYAKFLEGEWAIVSEDGESDFKLALAGNKNIWLESDLDFTSVAWGANISYDGEINGNGHTLRGISASFSFSKASGKTFGIFGTLGENAYLHDFTVENAQVTVSVGSTGGVGNLAALFAASAANGTKVENVTVTGTLTQGTVAEKTDITLQKIFGKDGGAVLTGCDFTGIVIADGSSEQAE